MSDFCEEESVILPCSEKSAIHIMTIGWLSRNNRFYGNDEEAARWDGCTHITCNCGEIVEKTSFCRPCTKKMAVNKYNQMPFKEWDQESPLYSQVAKEIFYEKEDIEDYLIDHPEETNLRLTICEPLKPPKIDDDYFYDCIADNMNIDDIASDAFKKAFNALNEIIENENWGWQAGDFRTEYVPKSNEG